MKTPLLLLFVLILGTNNVKATNYYFSAVSGDDSRLPAAAQNAATPWKTLDKLNAFFPSLKPGDSIFLKRNETFYGSIIIKKSGTATAPIFIGSFGVGNKPVITSLVTLTNWVFKGNGIWESYNSSLGSIINMALLNGAEQAMGRFPNADAANNGYLNFESHVGKTSITDSNFTSSVDWTGAELVTRPRHWILNRSIITSQSANKISYSTNSPYEPYENYGYFIQNSLKALDKLGEWYYNPSTKKISVYFGSSDPSLYVFQATTLGDLISSVSFSNVEFNTITIKGANGSGFNIRNGSNIKVQNCDILFSGLDAITASNHTNLTIQNCTISDQNNNGIDIVTGDNATITNNKVLNSYLVAGMGVNGEGSGIGININSSNSLIAYNEVKNTGFQGIYFNGSNVIIKNNLIDSFCITKDDGAGIYSTVGTVLFKGRQIIGNIILNGIGTGFGTNDSNKVAAHGIYMDNNAGQADIRDNTIANCSNNGFNIHNSFGMNMNNNTLYNNKIQVNMVQDADNVAIRNCTLTNNILFSKYKEQWVSSLASSGNDITLFGRFDSNYYARPIDDRITIQNNYTLVSGDGVTQSFDLEGWKEIYGKDKHSKKTARQIAPFNLNTLKGLNKFVNGGDFTTDIKGIASSLCITSFNTAGVLDSGCVQVAPTDRGSSLYFKIGAVTAGKNYILSYTIKGASDSNMTLGASIQQSAFPYTNYTPIQSRIIAATRSENQLLFSPSTTDSSATVKFKVDGQNIYYLDNIKFYEAELKVTNPDDSIRFVYNANNAVNSYNLNGNYIDATGKLFSASILLQPYTSAILIKTSGGVNNIAPIVNITSPVSDTSFVAPASVNISATAADADGSIVKVDFYNGTVLLGTAAASPYVLAWNNVAPGSYTVIVKATDNGGLTSADSVTVLVNKANVAPVVSVTSPLANALFTTPASIDITATATDSDGSVAKVDFYNGTVLLGTATASPYVFTWSNVAPGSYTVFVKATDNGGLTSADSVTVLVNKANVAPVVSVTSPLANANFTTPASIDITAAATDADGSVIKVDFYNGTVLLGTATASPYVFTWSNVAPGSYTVFVKATDNGGLTSADSVTVLVNKANVAPVVSVTSPLANALFTTPASIDITATATDADGSVIKVDFYNGTVLLGTATASPYVFTWSNVAPGNYSIIVKATDNGGLTSADSVAVLVNKANVAPVVSVTSPLANANFTTPASIDITAAATDADGSVAKVDFYNGTVLLGTATASPYVFTWSNVAPGRYSIIVKATDNGGLTSADSVTVIVAKANVAPVVFITSPLANAGFTAPASINISASASDADGFIDRIELYNGAALLTTERKPPYSWNWQNVPAGNYTITAVAFDNAGLADTSQSIFITVAENILPIVSIAYPANNSTYAVNSVIKIKANASNGNDSITKVELYSGTKLLKTETLAPYTTNWLNVPAGNYILTAKAYTKNGYTVISTPVSVTVLPSISNTNPIIPITELSSISAGDKLNLLSQAHEGILTTQLRSADVSIGPNPASNVVSVFTNKLVKDKKITISVCSVSGVMLQTSVSNTSSQVSRINISSLIAGMYLLKLQVNNAIIYKQFEKL